MRSFGLGAFACIALAAPVSGCAHRATPAPAPTTQSASIQLPAKRLTAREGKKEVFVAPPPVELRRQGDYVVHRFTGSFRKTPLLMTERVVAVDGSFITIDVSLREGTSVDAKDDGMRLRVVFDRTPGALREVAKVTRIERDREEPATLEDYEKLMAETVVVPDRNEDIVGSEIVTTDAAGKAIDCKKTSYRVAFGKKKAIMSTLSSDSFAWGDVGGEIKTEDGKVIYRAEVVEMGEADRKNATARR